MNEMAEALANPERTTRAIAEALLEAAPTLGDTEIQHVRVLVDKLTDRDLEIDGVLLPRIIIALGALFAAKTSTAPKQLWEQLWKDAPSDAWWHERVRPTKQEDEPSG